MSKIIASIFGVLLFGLPCVSCVAQNTSAPFLSNTEVALIVADSAARTMDWVSTEQGLNKDFRETRLPSALVKSKPAFALYEAGIVSGFCGAVYIAYRHHHRKLGWALQAAEIGAVTFIVKHNYGLHK
jgi:hypothetical protein